jgi:hypothetical protein
MDDSGGSSEGQNAERNADRKDHAHEVSNAIKDSFGNWSRGHSRFVAKNLSTFFLHLETEEGWVQG